MFLFNDLILYRLIISLFQSPPCLSASIAAFCFAARSLVGFESWWPWPLGRGGFFLPVRA